MGRRKKERPSKQLSPKFISKRLFGLHNIIRNTLIKIFRNTDTNLNVIIDINTGVIYDTYKPLIQKYSN